MVAGGTIMQLAAPLTAFWMFYKQRDFFAISVAWCWLGTNLFDVAAYASDARAGQLPLVSIGGGDVDHDWFVMLAETNLLNYDKVIGGFIHAAAIVCFLIGIGFGARILLQMRAAAVGRE